MGAAVGTGVPVGVGAALGSGVAVGDGAAVGEGTPTGVGATAPGRDGRDGHDGSSHASGMPPMRGTDDMVSAARMSATVTRPALGVMLSRTDTTPLTVGALMLVPVMVRSPPR